MPGPGQEAALEEDKGHFNYVKCSAVFVKIYASKIFELEPESELDSLHTWLPIITLAPVMRPLGRIVPKPTDVAPAGITQGVVNLTLGKGETLVLHDAEVVGLDGKHGKVAGIPGHHIIIMVSPVCGHLRLPHWEEEIHTRPWPVVGRDSRSDMKSSALDLYSS